jgi:DGQHR domain-containing protein
MPETLLEQRYGGKRLDLGVCALGQNLNLWSIRGFADLGTLASISGPDTYNQFKNPEGTQRNLGRSHSEEAVRYAIDSLGLPSSEDARAFPEIILNARNAEVIEFYDPESGSEIEFQESTSDFDQSLSIIGVRIKLDKLVFPIDVFNPEISRVDGNHRLSAAHMLIESEPEEELRFPRVPFALHVGLSKGQERKIFRDINGNHVGMQTAILDTFTLAIAGESAKNDEKMRPLWVAAQLCEEGHAFENMVSMGGGVQEYKERFGTVPPLRINTLKSAVKLTIHGSAQLSSNYKNRPDIVVSLVNAFWTAVKEVLPEMWADKKAYLLLDTIGLMSFSKWAGSLVDFAVHEGRSDVDYFKPYILAIADNVPLDRESNRGLAGAAGQKVIYEKLIQAASRNAVGSYKVMMDHAKDQTIEAEFGDPEN